MLLPLFDLAFFEKMGGSGKLPDPWTTKREPFARRAFEKKGFGIEAWHRQTDRIQTDSIQKDRIQTDRIQTDRMRPTGPGQNRKTSATLHGNDRRR